MSSGEPTKKELRQALRDKKEVRANQFKREAVEREEAKGFTAVASQNREEMIRFKVVRNAKTRWLHFSAGPGCPKEMHLTVTALDELIDKLMGARAKLIGGEDKDIEMKLSTPEFRRADKSVQDAFIEQLTSAHEREWYRKLQANPKARTWDL